jgi:hypothetical protein
MGGLKDCFFCRVFDERMRLYSLARMLPQLVFLWLGCCLMHYALLQLRLFRSSAVFEPPPQFSGVARTFRFTGTDGCAKNISLVEYQKRHGEVAGAILFSYITRARKALCGQVDGNAKFVVVTARTGLGKEMFLFCFVFFFFLF